VLRVLKGKTLNYDENVVRGILGDSVTDVDSNAHPPSVEPACISLKKAHRHNLPLPDFTSIAKQPIKVPSKERFEMIDGKMYILFEHSWTDADGRSEVYKQRDETRVYNPDFSGSLNLLRHEKDSEVIHPGTIRTFDKKDTGIWELREEEGRGNDAMGKWKRVYKTHPRDTSEVNAEAEPKFIARMYHRDTGAYLGLYKIGKSWADFENNVETFDINKREDVQGYNRWINQIRERYDYR
jgi:hypothetical protein